jgi:hypothetical protein
MRVQAAAPASPDLASWLGLWLQSRLTPPDGTGPGIFRGLPWLNHAITDDVLRAATQVTGRSRSKSRRSENNATDLTRSAQLGIMRG